MLEPREADLPILFLVLVVLPMVAYILLGKWSDAERKRDRVSLLAQLACEETLRAEVMFNPSASPLCPASKKGTHSCARCCSPATTRCSRCKTVRYCSGKCQIIHWRQIHRHECQQLETTNSLSSPSVGSPEDFVPETVQISGNLKSYYFGCYNQGETENSTSDNAVNPSISIDASVATTGSSVDKLGAMLWRRSTEVVRKDAVSAPESNRVAGLGIMKMMGLRKSTKLVKQAACAPGDVHEKVEMLFPYEEFMKIFDCEVISFSPRGLLNCGNSCYANAVLQCLTCTKPLIIFLLRRSHSQNCFRKEWCLVCELEQHALMLREHGGPLSPSRILLHMQNSNCQMGDGSQEDAHEFLRFLVASLQSICLEGLGGENRVDLRLQETTFVQHTFGGRLRSKVKCMRCHHESERYENIMDLTLEIFGVIESLEDALTQFTRSEDLDGENMYRCGRCSAYVRARKQLRIHEAPNILTIVLKRFQEGKYGKINKCISFPENLDMVPFMTGTGDIPPPYVLYGAVVHLDTLNASFSGHYVAYVKDLQGSWFRIDDSEVYPVRVSHVMSEGAYILFYKRSCPRPPKSFCENSSCQQLPLFVTSFLSRTQKPSRQGQTKYQSHFVGPQQMVNLKPSQSRTGITSHSHDFFCRTSNRKMARMKFSDTTTSSDCSLFTSSDDASFTTESTRDSFRTVDYADTLSSIGTNLYVPKCSSPGAVCCRSFSYSRPETKFFLGEIGHVFDSSLSGECQNDIWSRKFTNSLTEYPSQTYGSVKCGSNVACDLGRSPVILNYSCKSHDR